MLKSLTDPWTVHLSGRLQAAGVEIKALNWDLSCHPREIAIWFQPNLSLKEQQEQKYLSKEYNRIRDFCKIINLQHKTWPSNKINVKIKIFEVMDFWIHKDFKIAILLCKEKYACNELKINRET